MEKLAKIQKELKAPKGQYNSFGKYKYRSAEDILESVKPLLDGAILTLNDEIVYYGQEEIHSKNETSESHRVGQRFYVKATATFTDGDFTISTTAFAREPDTKTGMDSSQITGTASSYARKYALNGLFCIDDNKDADTDEYRTQTISVDSYKTRIAQCKTENEVNRLFYEWSKTYVKGTAEYLELGKVSAEQKKKVGVN